jgi:hypothetical protein
VSEYLPPTVATLLADISDYTKKLLVAAGEMEVFVKTATKHLNSSTSEFQRAGESAGRAVSSGLAKGAEKGSGDIGRKVTNALRSETSKFTDAGRKVADQVGGGIGKGISGIMSGAKEFVGKFGSALQSGLSHMMETVPLFGDALAKAASSNPYVAAGIAGFAVSVAAILAPALGAAITGALIGAAGLGVIIGGAILAASRSPEIKGALGELKKTVMGVDTEPLVKAYEDAQKKLTEAVKSGSGERIAAARKEVAETKKALDEGRNFNENNASLPDMAQGTMFLPLMKSIEVLKQGFKDLAPEIQKAFAAVAPAIVPLTEGVVGFIKEMMPGFLALLDAARPFLTQLAAALPILGDGFSKFFGELSKGGPGATVFFVDMIKLFALWIEGLGIALAWLAKMYIHVHDFFASIPGWISGAGQWFVDLWNSISSWFSNTWSAITGFFSSVGSAIAGFFTQTIPQYFNMAVAWFQSLPGKIGAALSALPGILKRAALAAFDAFFFAIGFAIGKVAAFAMGVAQWFNEIPGKIGAAMMATKNWIVSVWNSALEWCKQAIPAALSWVAIQWELLPARINMALTAAKNWILSKFTESKDAAVNQTQSLVNSVWAWISSLPGKISSALSSAKSAVLGAFSGAGSWLYSVGQDILRGMANGVSAAVNWAVDAAVRAAQSVVRGVKSALGISSPSKVFAELGKYTVQGFALGITDNAYRAVDAMRAMVSVGSQPGFTPSNLVTGGARGAALAMAGGGGGSAPPSYVPIKVYLGSTQMAAVQANLIQPAQRYKQRTGATGLA